MEHPKHRENLPPLRVLVAFETNGQKVCRITGDQKKKRKTAIVLEKDLRKINQQENWRLDDSISPQTQISEKVNKTLQTDYAFRKQTKGSFGISKAQKKVKLTISLRNLL